MADEQPILGSEKTGPTGLKTSFIVIQIILIIIQVVIILLLLAPHGYVYNSYSILNESEREYLNGYEMGRIALPLSAAFFTVLSFVNLCPTKKSSVLQAVYIVLHASMLFFVIVDSFKHVCIDTCGKYVTLDSGAGWTAFSLYLLEFWLIIASAIIVGKINKAAATLRNRNI